MRPDTYDLIKNILVIDIETVTCHREFDELSDRFKELWTKKAAQIKNPDELLPAELYQKRGAIYSEFGKVIAIAVGIFHKDKESEGLKLRVKDISGHDEYELLNQFKDLVHKFDQKQLRFVAHNGNEFDFPYLCRRMLVNAIEIPESLEVRGKKPWEIAHVDTMEMWKFGDRKNYTSLDLLAALFDVPTSKNDIDGSQVNKVYYEDDNLTKIAEYCKQDVVVTAQLYMRLFGQPLIREEDIEII